MAYKTYSSFKNDYSNISDDYGKFNKSFNFYTNPYMSSFSSAKDYDTSGLVALMGQAMQREQERSKGRSLLDRTFDALLVGNYASAGFVKGMVDGSGKNSVSPLEGFLQGLKAANPFGDGYTQGEHTYSKVLGEMGWNPESMGGKIAKGTLGFVGDVLLDPTTYLTGGVSALVKGTGRVGKAGQTVEKLTTQSAREIIEKQVAERGVVRAEEEIASDADKLAREYNRIMGVDRQGKGVNLSLGNLPFGEKIFGKDLAGKSITLASDEAARGLGDKTFAPYYKQFRDNFYGSKIGEMFSTTTPLYRIGKENPAQLYDFLKAVETIKGQGANKIEAEKLIQDKMRLFNLTPAENKSILKLMQDKSIWNKVTDFVKFTDTLEAKKMEEQLASTRAVKQQEYDNLMNQYSDLEAKLTEHGDVEDVARGQLEELKKKYRDTLIQFDVYATGDAARVAKHNEYLKRELAHVESGKSASFSDNFKSSLDTPKSVSESVDNLNTAIFGGEKVIGYSVPRPLIDEVHGMIKSGRSRDSIREHILSKEEDFAGITKAKYRYVANEMGYKDWKTEYHDRKRELLQRMLDGKGTEADTLLLKSLDSKAIKRAKLMKEFEHAHTHEQVQVIITKLENRKMLRELEEIDHLTNTTGSKANTKREEIRAKAMDDISAAERNGQTTGRGAEYDDVKSLDSEGNAKWDTRVTEHAERELVDPEMVKFDHKTEGLARYDIADFMKWNAEVKPLNEKQQEIVSKIFSHYEELINKSYHIPYDSLSESARRQIFKEARQKVVSEDMDTFKLKGEEAKRAIVEEVKKRKDKMTKEQFRAKLLADMERVKAEKTMKQDTVKVKQELLAKLAENEEKLKALGDTRESLVEDFKQKIADHEAHINDLNATGEQIKQMIKDGNFDKLPSLQSEVLRLDEALQSSDAFETYARVVLGVDTAPTGVAKIALDDMPYSDKVKEIVKMMRSDFIEVAKKEIEINKLTQEQVDFLFDSYIPNLLTPAGQRFIMGQKELTGRKTGVTRDIGFGQKFNPFSKERSVKMLKINGEWVENPTIEQKNEFFSQFLKGENAYVDQVADLYLTRMLKHTELVYDDLYMQTMLHEFGDEVGDVIKPNHSIVSNYGLVKKNLSDLASLKLSEEISEDVSEELRTWIMGRGSKPTKGQIKQFIEQHMATRWTEENLRFAHQNHLAETVESTGFGGKMLDDLATPMLQLTREHMDKFTTHYNDTLRSYEARLLTRERKALQYGDDEQIKRVLASREKLESTSALQIRQVNNAIVQKANQARKMQLAKDQNDMLKLYDKFTHLMKLNQTTVMPAFHIRNKMANTFLNWLGVGRDAFSIELQRQAWKAIKNKGQMSHTDVLFTKNGGHSWSDIYEQAKIHGVIDEGFFAKDIGAGAATKGMLKNVKPKFDPTDSENFFLYRKGGEIGNQIENSDRLLHFAALLKQGNSFEQAAYQAKQFLFDYSDLTSFEQQVMKRIFPFYTWMRKNSALQVEQLLEQPEKFRLVAKELNALEGGLSEDERLKDGDVANFAQDWIQLPLNVMGSGGKPEPVLFNPNLPFQDLSRIPNPLDPVNSIKQLFTQSNPLIKVPTEQVMNKNVFLDSPIVDRHSDSPEIIQRLKHVAAQFAVVNAATNLGTSDGADFGMAALNTFGGVKTMSYDVEGFKQMEQMNQNQPYYNPILASINRMVNRLGN